MRFSSSKYFYNTQSLSEDSPAYITALDVELDIITVANRSNLSRYLFKRNERQRLRVIGLQYDEILFRAHDRPKYRTSKLK